MRAIPALSAPVILVLGLLSGVATPTELGAITVVDAAILGFAYRELTPRKRYACIAETFVTSGVLLFIVQDIAKVSFGAVVWAILTFCVPLAVALLMVTYWPALSLWLPRMLE